MPKKGKKEGGLPSDFYLKLQRPKVFDRELKARDRPPNLPLQSKYYTAAVENSAVFQGEGS
jgi:hypothetical protein